MKKVMTAIIAMALLSFAPGRSIQSDLKALNKKMFMANSYRISASIVVDFKARQTKSTVSSMKLGNMYYYSFMDNIFLANKKVQLLINTTKKIILVQDSDQQEGKRDSRSYDVMLDTLLNKNHRYEPVRSNGNLHTIKTVFGPESDYTSLELTYDSQHYSLTSLEYTCGEKLVQAGVKHVSITYHEFNFEPKLSEKNFSETKFISIKGSRVTTSEQYKGYKIIDQRLDP